MSLTLSYWIFFLKPLFCLILQSVETPSFPVSSSVPPPNQQPRIPILIHLRSPCQIQSKASIILQPRIPNSTLVARVWPNRMATPVKTDTLKGSEIQSCNQSLSNETIQAETCFENHINEDHFIREHSLASPRIEAHPFPNQFQTLNNIHGQMTKESRDLQSQNIIKHSVKRKRGMQGDCSTQGSSSSGLEPVVAPSSKPWPVFTIANPGVEQTAQLPPKVEK